MSVVGNQTTIFAQQKTSTVNKKQTYKLLVPETITLHDVFHQINKLRLPDS